MPKPYDAFYSSLTLSLLPEPQKISEVPITCVFVHPTDAPSKDDVLCAGWNLTNACRDATRHAELVAVDRYLSGGVCSDEVSIVKSAETEGGEGGAGTNVAWSEATSWECDNYVRNSSTLVAAV